MAPNSSDDPDFADLNHLSDLDAGESADSEELHSAAFGLPGFDPRDREGGEAGVTSNGRGLHGSSVERLFRIPRRDFVFVVVLGLLQAAGLVAFIVLIMRIVGALLPGGIGAAADSQLRGALLDCALLAATGVVVGVLRTVEFTFAENVGYLVVRTLRMAMYEHLQRMLPAHLQHRARGGLLLRLTGDLSMLRMWLSRGQLLGTSAAIVLVTGLVISVTIDPWMACAIIAVIALGSALSLSNGSAMRSATRSMRRRRSLVIGNIDEQINTLPVLQVSGRAAGEFARLSRQNDSLTRSLMKVAGLRGRLRGIAVASSMLTTTAVLAVGVVQVHRGLSSIAEVVACVFVARYLSRSIRTLGLAHDYWHRGQVSQQKVVEFMRSAARPPEPGLERLRVRRGRIELHDVTVPGALDGFTATAQHGQIVGITGPSGAGKSTVLAVLARQVEPEHGMVMVDDQALSSTAARTLARVVGMASPDLPLLRGSIRRNLTYAAPKADAAEIQRVMLALGLDEVCNRLGPGGVNNWLVEGGRNLPAGDRQLVSLGRAMMGNPAILLLDEPLKGLSGRSRAMAREAILRYRGTVLWVTNEPSELANADEVWVMDQGRLADSMDGIVFRDLQWSEQQGGDERWRAPALHSVTGV